MQESVLFGYFAVAKQNSITMRKNSHFSGQQYYENVTLLEDFEDTMTASHDGVYGSPMKVEFISLHDDGGVTSVEDVGVSDTTVRYFNLQGLEVEKPQCGIYVELSNGRSRMVKL